jgi:hypothetical protein
MLAGKSMEDVKKSIRVSKRPIRLYAAKKAQVT